MDARRIALRIGVTLRIARRGGIERNGQWQARSIVHKRFYKRQGGGAEYGKMLTAFTPGSETSALSDVKALVMDARLLSQGHSEELQQAHYVVDSEGADNTGAMSSGPSISASF